YLRAAWDLHLVPSFVSSPFVQMLFYPASTLTDLGRAPVVGEWSLRLLQKEPSMLLNLWRPIAFLFVFCLGAAASLSFVLRFKANIFETSMATTTRVSENRLKARQGQNISTVQIDEARLARIPDVPIFRGVGAVVWKNLVVASRSKR